MSDDEKCPDCGKEHGEKGDCFDGWKATAECYGNQLAQAQAELAERQQIIDHLHEERAYLLNRVGQLSQRAARAEAYCAMNGYDGPKSGILNPGQPILDELNRLRVENEQLKVDLAEANKDSALTDARAAEERQRAERAEAAIAAMIEACKAGITSWGPRDAFLLPGERVALEMMRKAVASKPGPGQAISDELLKLRETIVNIRRVRLRNLEDSCPDCEPDCKHGADRCQILALCKAALEAKDGAKP